MSSSPTSGLAQTSLFTTQYSGRSRSRSESSGSKSVQSVAGSQHVRPNARLPLNDTSIARILMHRASSRRQGFRENTYALQYSLARRTATVPSGDTNTLRPVVSEWNMDGNNGNVWFHFVVLALDATGGNDGLTGSVSVMARVGDILPMSISGASIEGCWVRNTDSSGKSMDMSISACNGKLLDKWPSENTHTGLFVKYIYTLYST